MSDLENTTGIVPPPEFAGGEIPVITSKASRLPDWALIAFLIMLGMWAASFEDDE